jgi:hypothetical protein
MARRILLSEDGLSDVSFIIMNLVRSYQKYIKVNL